MNMKELEKEIKLLIYELTGAEFENFIVKVYKIEYGNDFIKIKPDGNIGDLANDGYICGELLIQVYSPETPKASEAINKISHDYERAKKYWDFKEWHFVYNDKFRGIPTRVALHVEKLNKNENIELKLISSEDIIDKILLLAKEKPYKIWALINYNKEIENFDDFEILSSVIDYLATQYEIKNSDIEFYNFANRDFLPGTHKKIEINIKDESFKDFFTKIVLHSKYIINQYQNYINTELETIGNHIKKLYNTFKEFGAEQAIIEIHKSLKNELLKNHMYDKNIDLACWVIIGYFFDICDIGEISNGNGE
ncbi:hypothetical protein [Nautilia sp.]